MSLLVALDVRLAGRDATGDSTYWTGLLSGLAELDTPHRYLLCSNRPPPPEIPVSPRFEWITVPAGSSRWWSLVRFPLAARRRGAQVLHTQYNLSPLAGRHGVTTIHDVSFFIGPEWFRPRDRSLLRQFVPGSARRAKRIMAVSETSKAEILRYIPEAAGKVVVALNGRNPALVPLDKPEAQAIVERDFANAPPFVLTVGTRWPRKNIKLAIAACDLLPPHLPHRLVVTGKAGWGDEAPGARTVATGYVSESQLSALYSAADLYLAPSFHEGFGIPVVEAFACGCPVLCSSGGALPEVAAEAGCVEPSWEAADWSARMVELLSDSSKLATMRQKGLERAKEFSWRRSAESHERAYSEAGL